ncbi:MAG: asparagine synthase (glutamine-hydrolyzing) [Pseudolabrys sp.]
MCGIVGFVDGSEGRGSDGASAAGAMTASLQYRGPDDEGVWADDQAGIALGHRRLSIIDLSAAGHEPMVSHDGRYVITYNGEVYDYGALRAELQARGVKFIGHSDTEVLLESIAAYGVEAMVPRLIGMFAFAVWDRKERALKLVRDRLGIKPLYWGKFGSLFLFGSEIKALRAHPGWTPRIDRGAVASYLRHSYIPAPHTIYQHVHKLEPGKILTLPWHGEPGLSAYWNARDVALQGIANPLQASDSELTDRLEKLALDAVRMRMIADVPLGALLSGGVDSSTVVALMRAANVGPVKTFTVGFAQSDYDESAHAEKIAKHLGTEHHTLPISSRQALDVIPRLPDYYDEPFADSSQIPTYLISAMTRQHVTVALSGDGGDELFAGYNRYQAAGSYTSGIGGWPRPMRKTLGAALTSLSPERWDRLAPYLPSRLRVPQLGDKLYKLANLMQAHGADESYRSIITHWEPAEIMPDAAEPNAIWSEKSVNRDFPDLVERMQFIDLVSYLPDDILTKLDRASMAFALEARVPLLDHRLVEFAWALPRRAKLRGNTTKWLLRQVLYKYVPAELIERPKMGFAIPLAEWLRGPLRDWAETLLEERRLRATGFVQPARIRTLWQEHLGGRRNHQHLLWNILMLEAWHERWQTPALNKAA